MESIATGLQTLIRTRGSVFRLRSEATVNGTVRVIEAVVRLFNKHGNRNNKNKARLKFVLRERGWVYMLGLLLGSMALAFTLGGLASHILRIA